MRIAGLLTSFVILAAPAMADGIVVPANLSRDRQVTATYRLDRPATGSGTLYLEWIDADDRTVERRQIAVTLDRQDAIDFPLDLTRVAAVANRVRAHLVLDESGAGRHEANAVATFFVPPAKPAWSDFEIIMWQAHNAAQWQTLKSIGIGAGELHPDRDDPARLAGAEINPLIEADLGFYVENIATDFYSAYHRWTPDHPVNWRFTEIQKLYRDEPQNPAVYERYPSLVDPAWLARIATRLGDTVRAYRRFQPLFYNLADEGGIADLAANWDFDRGALSLANMRRYLAERYGSLDALNAEWGTDFARWDDVMPMTTKDAIARAGDNFAPWADFKEWMDESYARAMRVGSDAVRAADPHALPALEGGQLPGPGGWDYARLAKSVDVMEIDDDAGSLEIVRSVNPRAVLLTTSAGSGPAETHRIWRELLRGMRGLIIWENDPQEFIAADGTLGPRGKEMASTYQAIRAGLGAQLMASDPAADPVAILYSPSSIRTQWILDRQHDGDAWSTRGSEAEGGDNTQRQAVRFYLRLTAELGLKPRMVSSAQLEDGDLAHGSDRLLILPDAVALSSGEANAIRRFVAAGGTVIADRPPGVFDQHSRRRPAPALADLFAAGPAGRAFYLAPEIGISEALPRMRAITAAAAIAPAFAVNAPNGAPITNVETYVFHNGQVTILGLLQEPDASGGAAMLARESIELPLPGRPFVYDLRRHEALGRRDRLTLDLDPVAPTLLALADTDLPAPTIAAASSAALGSTVALNLSVAGTSVARTTVLHVDIIDPAGKVAAVYSGNLAMAGRAVKLLPLALNDPAGTWTIRVTDILSGQQATATLAVAAP